MSQKSITLRVQARDGTKRVQLLPSTDTRSLYEETRQAFGYRSCAFRLFKDRAKTEFVNSTKSKTLGGLGMRHGEMLYLVPEEGVVLKEPEVEAEPKVEAMDTDVMEQTPAGPVPGPSNSSNGSAPTPTGPPPLPKKALLKEDDVDIELATRDGKIERKRDPQFCKHTASGQKCSFCSALDPFDEAYLKDNKIKHLSFHSYLRKLTSGVDKGKFVALEDLTVKIKEGCTSHAPWPKGICSKCQPSAVTLNRQTYRHVDSVMIENPNIVERFISYWRASGYQRMGLLYGSYEEHGDVPLGIRARVAAIYEPHQDNDRDALNFHLNDEKLPIVNEIAQSLGLRCVGWIFTDLMPEDVSKGTVKHNRGGHSFFLSSQECITAAYFQSLNPNVCKHSPTGYFGSKFATVIITGDDKNQVQMEGYQVSNQCMALVRDQVFVPTKDAPELGYVKESTNEQYVPEVYYKHKDEYGNEVPKIARPLPVEYLLVDVPVSTPKTPQSTFSTFDGQQLKSFPVENRPVPGHIQDFHSLATYLNQFPPNTPFLMKASDLHFLVFIATMDIVQMKDYIGPLLEAVRTRDEAKANDWAKSEHWATVEQLIAAASGGGVDGHFPQGGGLPGVATDQTSWTCAHCTFHNVGNSTNCEMCQLPR